MSHTSYSRGKAALFSNKNALHYRLITTKLTEVVAHAQTVNSMTLQEYPFYRRHGTDKKLLCPSKMPFPVDYCHLGCSACTYSEEYDV